MANLLFIPSGSGASIPQSLLPYEFYYYSLPQNASVGMWTPGDKLFFIAPGNGYLTHLSGVCNPNITQGNVQIKVYINNVPVTSTNLDIVLSNAMSRDLKVTSSDIPVSINDLVSIVLTSSVNLLPLVSIESFIYLKLV